MTTSVHDVVAFLLRQAQGHLSVSAVHKLCYYVQGHSLAWQDAPMFPEELQLRSTGPVVPALYPLHKDTPYTVHAWPAGSAANLSGPEAVIVQAVFKSRGHLSGLIMADQAREHAPCLRAAARSETEKHPVIDLADMKAFFKALDDAPATEVEYANRFIANYA